jgi:hypothetical protein
MFGVGEAVERCRSVRSVVIITMSEQEVPVSVAQCIIIKFLSREDVKPAQILRRLTEQFKEETLSRARVFAWHRQFVSTLRMRAMIADPTPAWQRTTFAVFKNFLRVTGI